MVPHDSSYLVFLRGVGLRDCTIRDALPVSYWKIMVEAAGVELRRHLKARQLLMTKRREGPKSPECQIGCTFIVRRQINARCFLPGS